MNDFLQSISDISLPGFSLSALIEEMPTIVSQLHFIRPGWFYAFIPVVIYLLLFSRRRRSDRNWIPVIDQDLMPYVLIRNQTRRRRRYPVLLILIATSLCITALAGPVYKKLPQPVYREQSALVVLLDLSASMNANDIKPSRLARARLELLDILEQRKTGQTALIVYAADAFVVTPLTDDNSTIANLIPALDTEMMPAQGSNLSIALAKAASLLTQAGIVKGDILVVTDDIKPRYESTIEKITSQGHRLSIFGIGTADGAPIPLSNSQTGGFLIDKDGAIVIPRLDSSRLQRYALRGNGLYTGLSADDSDTEKLSRLFQADRIDENRKHAESDDGSDDLFADTWQEEAHWLLLPLLLLAALWARKGWISALLPFFITTTLATGSLFSPQNALAEDIDAPADPDTLIDFDNLWSTPDQKAMSAFDAGDNQKAAETFQIPEWKASAQYRAGDYEGALQTLSDTDTSRGLYNKGNALARLGRYPEAISAYDKALEIDKDNEDARYNRELVKKTLQDQQQNQQQDQQDQQDKQQNDQQNQQQDEQDQQDKQQNDQQNQQQDEQQKNPDQQNQQQDDSDSQQDQQDSESGENQDQQQTDSADEGNPEQNQPDQQDSEQQNPKQQNSEQQKQSEEKELKQRDAEKEKQQQQQEQQEYENNKDKQDQQSDSVEHKQDQSDRQQDPKEIEINPVEASISEQEKAAEQWLKRVPDDPSGLLRRKFLYQYNQNAERSDTEEPW